MNKKKLILIIAIGIFIISGLIYSFFFMESDKYITIYFDSNGGSEVIGEIVKNGNVLIKPEDPIKEGFIFKEWTLNNKKYDFTKKVYDSFTLKALWEKEVLINLNDNIKVIDYSAGTLCWDYSYPINVKEVYGIELDSFHFMETERKIVEEKYKKELENLNEKDREKFIEEKQIEVDDMHSLLIYDEEKTNEVYDKLNNLSKAENEGIVNFKVSLNNNKITYGYEYLLFEDDYISFEKDITNFKTKLDNILKDAFYIGGGCGDYEDYTVLDENICDKYNLSCDRW